MILIGLVCIAAVPPGAAARQLCTQPLSLTPLLGPDDNASLPPGAQVQPLLSPATAGDNDALRARLRARLLAPTRRDQLHFWLHAALGAGMDRGGCDATASGVQWVKAAIHARSVDQAERAAGGIAGSVTRAAAPSDVARDLCLAASPRIWYGRDHVALTFALAGVYCVPGIAPAHVRVLEGSLRQ